MDEKAPIDTTDRANPLDENTVYVKYKEYYKDGGQRVDLESLKKHEETKSRAVSAQAFAEQHGIDIDELLNLTAVSWHLEREDLRCNITHLRTFDR